MKTSLELHLGLVRLSVALGNLQRAVEEVLSTGGLTLEDDSSDELIAEAQYLALEAAIRSPEVAADRGSPIALKKDDKSMLLRITYPTGQHISRDDLLRVLDAASLFPDSSSPANGMRMAARG